MANATPTLVTVTDVMPLRGPAAAVAYLLATARANGMRVNRTKLAKLLYLADLRAVERGLPPGSGVEWRRRNYGPHSRHLIEVESDLHEAGVIRELFPTSVGVVVQGQDGLDDGGDPGW